MTLKWHWIQNNECMQGLRCMPGNTHTHTHTHTHIRLRISKPDFHYICSIHKMHIHHMLGVCKFVCWWQRGGCVRACLNMKKVQEMRNHWLKVLKWIPAILSNNKTINLLWIESFKWCWHTHTHTHTHTPSGRFIHTNDTYDQMWVPDEWTKMNAHASFHI